MSKEKLKDTAVELQNGRSLSGEELPTDEFGDLIYPLVDTHRPTPRAEGGIYTDENTKVMLPTEHRDLHGNTPWLEDPQLIKLRAIMEDYRTCMKLRMKIDNHYLAVKRQMDEMTPEIAQMFEDVGAIIIDREKGFRNLIAKQLKEVDHPMIDILQGIKGLGPITAAEIITIIDIRKARHVSSLWSFVGYAGNSKDRYVKGQKGGGHKHLRTVLYNLGSSFMRANNEDYRAVYDRRKEKTSNSEKTIQHKSTRSSQWTETAWKDVNPGRRHMDALRVMLKHFLADLWYVWREIEGLPASDLYVKEHLGHISAVVDPRERGWMW